MQSRRHVGQQPRRQISRKTRGATGTIRRVGTALESLRQLGEVEGKLMEFDICVRNLRFEQKKFPAAEEEVFRRAAFGQAEEVFSS